MEMTNEKIVEKKVYEEGKQKEEYASKGVAGTALGLGIAGTALGVLPWLFGGGRSGGIAGGGASMPENVNINAYGYGGQAAVPTALSVEEKECADVLALTNTLWGLKVNTADKFYAMRAQDAEEKFSLYKGYRDGYDALLEKQNRDALSLYKSQTDADFGLYKAGRDQFDATNARISELDKKVAVMEATRPYQDKLLMQAIDMMGERQRDYTDRKTCRCIYGVVGLPSTPTVSVLEGANPFGCNCKAQTTATPTA